MRDAEIRRAHPGAEEHVHLARMRDVGDQQQAADLDIDAGFFPRLARGPGLQRLVVFHKPRGNGPVPQARLDAALADQDASLVLGHTADDEFRVLVVDGPAVLADVARQQVALRNFEDDSGATVAAEVHRLN